jgi:hypothetical protein
MPVFLLLLLNGLCFSTGLAQGLSLENVQRIERPAVTFGRKDTFLQLDGNDMKSSPALTLKRALLGDDSLDLPGRKKFGKLHRAFFCRIEDAREEKAGLGLKFRLGTVPYVDRLEGKTTTAPPGH